MQVIEEPGPCMFRCPAQWRTGTVFGIGQLSGCTQCPVLEAVDTGVDPRANSGFTRMYFLPTADETNDNCPATMPVHVFEQEFRLG